MGIKKFFKSKKIKDNSIAEKKKNIELITQKAVCDDRDSIFEFDIVKKLLNKLERVNDVENYASFYELFYDWDEFCHLNRTSGEIINSEMKNHPENILGIHRTNLGDFSFADDIPHNTILDNIMEVGLINNGHVMQGGFMQTPNPNLTVSPLDGVSGLISLITSYKDNNATVLLSFPREYVTDELDLKKKNIVMIFIKNKMILYILFHSILLELL